MISYIGIISFVFILLGFIVSQFVEDLIYDNKANELIEYGENILNEFNNDAIANQMTIYQYEDILNKRNIYFSLFDTSGQLVYPVTTAIRNQNIRNLFSETEWDRIKQGKRIIVNIDLKRFEQAVSLVVLPYIKDGEFLGGIMINSPVSGINEMLAKFNRYLVFTVLVILFASFLLSWALSIIHVRRINQLKNAVSTIASGNYDVKVKETNFDEIGELAVNFNIMAEKLKKSMEEIDNLENRRRQFIADVSHEMRTPLTTISGVIEGFKNDMISESQREKALDLVGKEAKRLIRLVNENLDYEKIRANQIQLHIEKIELLEVFEVVMEQLEAQATSKNNKLQIEIFGDPVCYADYDRLIQILLNILKNSIQFTENGLITLRGKQDNTKTIIEIEDTGIGMDPNEVEKIWQRFYRADISRRSNPFGEFGLGLSIVQKLVLLHDGEIFVESEKGKGSKFTIYLPLRDNESQ